MVSGLDILTVFFRMFTCRHLRRLAKLFTDYSTK